MTMQEPKLDDSHLYLSLSSFHQILQLPHDQGEKSLAKTEATNWVDCSNFSFWVLALSVNR